jgi:hypothetical protein
MDSIERQERRHEAWRRLQAQRRRAGQLRGRVVAISLIAFAMLWGTVFVQMATGNDPVLGDRSTATAGRHPAGGNGPGSKARTAPVASGIASEAEVEATELEAAKLASEVEAVEPEPAPVVTAQS